MENFKIAINAVLPLFFTMAVGYFLRQIHFVDEPLLKKLNKLVFNVFLPLLLFINIYQSDLETSFRLKTILTAVCSVLALFVVLCAVVPLIEKDGRRRGVIVQGIFRSNYILFGAPLVFGVFGDQGMGTVSVISAFVVPLYNMLSVAALETFSQGQVNVKKILKGIVKNPLIIASALGILCLVASVPLPQAVEKTVSDLGKVATPLGLVSLGGFFKFSDTKRFIKQLVIIVTGRLILCPAAFLPIFIKMGFRDVELMALVTMMGAPIAVSSFIMAQQHGADADLAGQSVAFPTLFSVFTMFLIIFELKQMRFI